MSCSEQGLLSSRYCVTLYPLARPRTAVGSGARVYQSRWGSRGYDIIIWNLIDCAHGPLVFSSDRLLVGHLLPRRRGSAGLSHADCEHD